MKNLLNIDLVISKKRVKSRKGIGVEAKVHPLLLKIAVTLMLCLTPVYGVGGVTTQLHPSLSE